MVRARRTGAILSGGVRSRPVILTVNAGSSSVRLALFAEVGGKPERRASARYEGHPGEAARMIDELRRGCPGEITRVAHRVVHGGPDLGRTCPIDTAVEQAITAATPLAPLHNPAALGWVKACRKLLPGAVALAVFDSGFFSALPPVATRYALPATLGKSLRRLGFHGLAHRSMADALGRCAPGRTGRVITFQLGGGCSAAALRAGQPIDTSMGFTPLEGLVMGTRAGDIDAGLVLHLLAEGGRSPDQLRTLLDEQSGLLGLAGTDDVRVLTGRSDEAARLALDLFCYRIRKYLGAYLAALGGCDAVAFGGGIGEHAPAVRARALEGLEPLGLRLDQAANDAARAPARISHPASAIEIWVVPTDEETVLAEEALACR
jgi:acetate kinase